MELKIASECSSSPRREFRFSRAGRNQKSVSNNILEAIAQFSGGEPVATENGRLKIVVKKEDLKHVLEAIGGSRSSGRRVTVSPPGVTLEQRLNFMRRRQILRVARSRGPWRPVLQSIPEEL